jgi:hypothetical protein
VDNLLERNTIGGSVSFTNNTAANQNAVWQNTIGGSLACSGNNPNLGSPNTVGGSKSADLLEPLNGARGWRSARGLM